MRRFSNTAFATSKALIEKLWKDKTYETVCLDFSMVVDFNTVDDFKVKFYSMLSEELEAHGSAWNGKSESSYQLSRWFRGKADASLVLLIDEYDSPLTKVLNKKELFEGIQKVMQEFFVMLKSNDGCFNIHVPHGHHAAEQHEHLLGPQRHGSTSPATSRWDLDGLQSGSSSTTSAATWSALRGRSGISRESCFMREYYDGFSFDKDADACVLPVVGLELPGKHYRFENYWFEFGGSRASS